MTGGRVIFGSGPGALPSDAHTFAIDPMVLRDRQDEALGVILRLLRGEPRFSYETDWFKMKDAQLQLLPVQEKIPAATASMVSPSGMTLAGKHGIGALSIGSMASEGITALATQWDFAEDAAKKSGCVINPDTPIDGLLPFLSELDLVLVMSVVPGKGGQSFMPEVEGKVREFRSAIDEQISNGGRATKLMIDGGIKHHNSAMVSEWGIDVAVVGSGLINDKASIAENLAEINTAMGL